jgi:hypothetical protein
MCFKGIAKTFENSKYMKPSNESTAGCALRMFLKGGRAYCKAKTFNVCCIHVIK